MFFKKIVRSKSETFPEILCETIFIIVFSVLVRGFEKKLYFIFMVSQSLKLLIFAEF